MSSPKSQAMKPATAAKKLGIYLPATPADFQEQPVTREQFLALQSDPPEWLTELRRNGPHPRPEVARKLNISISGLTRGGVTEPLTTEQIKALLVDPPAWLVEERARFAAVREEDRRVKEQAEKDAAARERAEESARSDSRRGGPTRR